jgi:hypothetical protein
MLWYVEMWVETVQDGSDALHASLHGHIICTISYCGMLSNVLSVVIRCRWSEGIYDRERYRRA